MRIDLSLSNAALYAGCEIETVAGRGNLKTPVADAVNLVGANIAKIVAEIHDETDVGQLDGPVKGPVRSRQDVTLTGPMAVWAYLVVFHAVVHSFSRVYYDDGRNGPVLVAAHG